MQVVKKTKPATVLAPSGASKCYAIENKTKSPNR